MNDKAQSDVSFCRLLAILFIAFKLSGIITWSWVWVLSPIWIPIVIVSLIALLMWLLNKEQIVSIVTNECNKIYETTKKPSDIEIPLITSELTTTTVVYRFRGVIQPSGKKSKFKGYIWMIDPSVANAFASRGDYYKHSTGFNFLSANAESALDFITQQYCPEDTRPIYSIKRMEQCKGKAVRDDSCVVQTV